MSSEVNETNETNETTGKKPKSGLVFAVGMVLLLTMLVYLNMG